MKPKSYFCAGIAALAISAIAGSVQSSDIPRSKKTIAGYYLTATEAAAMLENALSLNPDSPGYYAGTLAVARVGTGLPPDEMITMMQELLSHDPINADYCRYLSALLTFEGRHKEALAMAKKAVSLNPKFIAEYYQYLGIPYFMMGEHDEAIATVRPTRSKKEIGHPGLRAG